MLTILACLALGLFVGGYALSSFAPVSVAETIYQRNWVTWGLFLALAYLQKLQDTPVSSEAQGAPRRRPSSLSSSLGSRSPSSAGWPGRGVRTSV